MTIRKIFKVFSIGLLIYMIWPGPGKIDQFGPLPNSVKSTLEGDTIQIPNVSAYFSDNYRDFVVPFYQNKYWVVTLLPFPPYRLNYAPEYSWTVIKKHTDSTYLEELVYPLRGSLYVNGLEPFTPSGEPRWWGAGEFQEGGKATETKVTLRYYPSSVFVRFIVWVGIVSSIFFLYKLSKRIIFNKYA